jgi:hypothetical protein
MPVLLTWYFEVFIYLFTDVCRCNSELKINFFLVPEKMFIFFQ